MTRRPAFLALSLLLTTPAQAGICDDLLQCCLQTVEAHVERGLTGIRVTQSIQTCHVHEGLSMAPTIQETFCIEAYYLVSQSAWEDFQAGRIGFYPEPCNPDPTTDPDEELAPSLEELEAEEDAEDAPEDAE